MKKITVLFLVGLSFFGGCGEKKNNSSTPTIVPQSVSSQEEGPKASEAEWQAALNDHGKNDFKPFVLYSDKGSKENHYVPSGFMPDGQCVKLDDSWREGCYSGTSCIKAVYDVECSKKTQKWVGVYWQNPANNWGKQKGGFNLTGATKLTFWAKGEKGGERIEEFKIGGITGDYPDSDSAVIGPVILTNEWKQYTIDLRAKDLSYLIGGFAWATNVDVNPESCTFYLDDIRYVGQEEEPKKDE